MEAIGLVVAFILVWIVFLLFIGFRQVEQGYIMAVFRLGVFVQVKEAGPRMVIPFLDRTEIYPTQTKQFEFPAEPGLIDRDNDTVTPGMVLPFRIHHKGLAEALYYVRKDASTTEPSSNPEDYKLVSFSELTFKEREQEVETLKQAMERDSLHAALTAEWPVAVEWHLVKEHLLDLINNVDPQGGRDRVEEVNKRMNDTIDSTLQEVLGMVTLGHAISNKALFDTILQERLEQLVGEKSRPGKNVNRPWGIAIDRAFLKSPNPGKRVNVARAEAGAALSKKEERIRLAEAELGETKLRAEGKAYDQRMQGEGERDRLNALDEAMQRPYALALLQLEAGKEALARSGTVVVSGGMAPFADLIAMGTRIAAGQTPTQALNTQAPQGEGSVKRGRRSRT